MFSSPSGAQYLPSLLDRLTDDDPVNQSIKQSEHSIRNIEKTLSTIKTEEDPERQEINKEKCAKLSKQLDHEQAQYRLRLSAVSSLGEIRACVKRDLDWLLNAHNYFPQKDIEDYPEVRKSVINYGVTDFSGKTTSGIEVRQLERLLKQAIIDFEPRIIKNTLDVHLIADKTLMNYNAMTFEIEGELWSDPLPIHLHLLTELELENGSISITDYQT
ncbi:hypothetical protein MNBD_GAMMA13-1143 [hydrothermal vent metagenome]|uniref:IraD/Gp25-like domain-containing protein n=1 Tax=hydrothermal vent metagenome TaxID=652676 RepID=A0A3B0YIQ2_9ZZZZ